MLLEQGLFRKEVMAARRGQWLGAIHVATPLSRWAVSCVSLSMAVLILGYLFLGHYTRRERVSGELVPSAGLLSVRSTVTGVVTRLDVSEGQSIHKGDPLLAISTDVSSAALGNTRSRISAQLISQRFELRDEIRMRSRREKAKSAQLKEQLKLLLSQRERIDTQVALQRKEIKSDTRLLDRIRPLSAKGYVSAIQIQQQQGVLLTAQAQLQTLKRQRAQTEMQMSDVGQQLRQLPMDLSMQESSLRRQLDAINQQLAQNEARRSIVLRASSTGTVSSLRVSKGQSVISGEGLLDVMPSGSPLKARLLIPSRAVGFIHAGRRVVLRYQAFPYQKFGQYYGRVSDISLSALSPIDVQSLAGTPSAQPMYQVRVTLDQQYVWAYGKQEWLKPGMALSADVLMDRRRLIEWVLEPLYGLDRGAIHVGAINE